MKTQLDIKHSEKSFFESSAVRSGVTNCVTVGSFIGLQWSGAKNFLAPFILASPLRNAVNWQSISPPSTYLSRFVHPVTDLLANYGLCYLPQNIRRVYAIARLLGGTIQHTNELRNDLDNCKTKLESFKKIALHSFNFATELFLASVQFKLATETETNTQPWEILDDSFSSPSCSKLKPGWEKADNVSWITDHGLKSSSRCDALNAFQVMPQYECEQAMAAKSSNTTSCLNVCQAIDRAFQKMTSKMASENDSTQKKKAKEAVGILTQMRENLATAYQCGSASI